MEFTLTVREKPDGGFFATCRSVITHQRQVAVPGAPEVTAEMTQLVPIAETAYGHGATPMAACIAALMNSRIQDESGTETGQ